MFLRPLALLLLGSPLLAQGPPCFGVQLRLLDGWPVPTGGTLEFDPLATGLALTGGGRAVFVGGIAGQARNQALFLADGVELRPLVVGCGGFGGSASFGGCGDPAPGGGTFGGLFPGLAPATNAVGDVLFLADLAGTASTRGLYLYRASTGQLEAVARVGDLSPTGQTLQQIGPGSLNDQGEVAFLAGTGAVGTLHDQVLRRGAGGLELVAAVGSPVPGGGSFSSVQTATGLLPDGTLLPGRSPVIDGAGRVVFLASWGSLSGLIVHTPGAGSTIAVQSGDPSPALGIFWQFAAPTFDAAGDLHFVARSVNPGTVLGPFSWFQSTPNGFVERLRTGDVVDGATLTVFSPATGPGQQIGPAGELVLWARLARPSAPVTDAVIRVPAGGPPSVVLEVGGSSRFGGTTTGVGGSPAADAEGRVLVAESLTGGPGSGVAWLLLPCGVPTAYCEAKTTSAGCVPRIGSAGAATMSGPGSFVITASGAPSGQPAMLFYGFTIDNMPFQGGLRCVADPVRRTGVQVAGGAPPSSCSASLTYDFQARIRSGVDPSLAAGTAVYAQWYLRDPGDPQGLGLTDALFFTIAP